MASAAEPMGPVRAEWRAGWTLVLSCMTGMSLWGFAPLLLGMLMKPLQAEFGWQRTEISAMMLFASIAAFLIGPMIGLLIDRFGSRKVGLSGIATLTGSLACMALAGPHITSWLVLSTVYGVLAQAGNAVTWTKAVASRFSASRGLALSVTLAGLGLCNLLAPFAAVRLLEHFGWRGVYVGIAAIGFVIAFSFAFFFLYDAADLARKQGSTTAAQAAHARAGLVGATVAEALRTPRFWIISISICIAAAAVGGLLIHLQPLMTDAGFTPGQAALLFSIVFGPFSILGRITIGYLLDRFYAPLISALAFALPALAMLLLTNRSNEVCVTIGAILSGVSLGAEIQIVAFLTAHYFGVRHYGKIYGLSYGFYSIGFGAGPVLAAAAFDWHHSYDSFLWICFVALIGAVIAIACLGRPPVYEPVE